MLMVGDRHLLKDWPAPSALRAGLLAFGQKWGVTLGYQRCISFFGGHSGVTGTFGTCLRQGVLVIFWGLLFTLFLGVFFGGF